MPHLTGSCHLIKNGLTRSCWSEGRSEQSDTANAPCFPVPSQETGGKNEGRCGKEVTKRLSKEITDPLGINSISGLVSCILFNTLVHVYLSGTLTNGSAGVPKDSYLPNKT